MLAAMEMEATTMASNVYTNLTPAANLDKKTLNKMVWRSLNLQASFNYERMQAAGWLYGILPGLLAIHGEDTDDLNTSMAHNLEFFNTHPFLVTFVMGIVLSLEQQKADVGTIRAVRVAAMGPLGGIGDAIFWFTLVPIAANIDFFFEIFALGRWFRREDVVYDDGTYPDKGAMHLEAARRLGVTMEDCLVIEDSPSSIRHALSNGAGRVVAVGTTVSEEELLNMGVTHFIRDFTEFDYSWLHRSNG